MKRKILKILTSIILGITTVSIPACTAKTEATSPEISTTRVSVHDPSIVKDNDCYYLFGTHLTNAKSSDLASWEYFNTNVNDDFKDIFANNIKWSSRGKNTYDAKGNLWAPDVIYNTEMKKWCMYMSINGEDHYSSIALATADNIDGPYTYSGTVVYSGFTNSDDASNTDFAKVTGANTVPERYVSYNKWNSNYGPNAIDPCIVYDKDGQLWMSYGSWFGGIFLLKLDNNTGLRDYSYTYKTERGDADEYLGKLISGGYGGTGEGSYIVYDKETDYYYLYESYCGLESTTTFSNYQIRLFRSKNIDGPYIDAKDNTSINSSNNPNQTEMGIKLFGNYKFTSLESADIAESSQNGYKCGGHNSAIIDDDGSHYLIYHTRFDNATEYHEVRVHQQFLNEDGWPVTAVYEYLGSKINEKGYSKKEIVGEYEFINHGLDATTSYSYMLDTYRVMLNKDGSITGDFTGTWIQNSDSYYCTMEIDGVTFKGVFFKQYDESAQHKETMTFSLIGNNNVSIWGSKLQ